MENCTKRIKIPLSANYYLLDKLIFKWINKDKDHKRIIKRLYKKFKTTNNMKKKKKKKTSYYYETYEENQKHPYECDDRLLF